jgi:hypothetical protein
MRSKRLWSAQWRAFAKRRLKAEKFRGSDVTYNPQHLLRTKTWWYIPFT